MKRLPASLITIALLLVTSDQALAVSGVDPSGVNVDHTGVTTVFLTFQNLGANEQPVDAFWCGDVAVTGVSVDVNPCVPGTILGSLPARLDLSRGSGTRGISNFTDIMTIPASVARRAFQEARGGADSEFFYVRRFNDGVRDTYVTVTCRLAGSGARVPLALTHVEIMFETAEGERPVYFLSRDSELPQLGAHIRYNGTGQLLGRWEVVLPGDPEPRELDLLTEATLPAERRALQRRYTLIDRFSVFLPPADAFYLPGPRPDMIPHNVDGPHKILLRIEASADKEGNSNTLAGTAISGGVAGFPMPVLRYYVGSPEALATARTAREQGRMPLLLPQSDARLDTATPVLFSWIDVKDAMLYELEVQADGETILSAVTRGGTTQYTSPPWLAESAEKKLRWRVRALSRGGSVIANSEWRSFVFNNRSLPTE